MCVSCSIFGHEGDEADDVAYVNWLSMVRAGLLGLEFYSPDTDKWRQVCGYCFSYVAFDPLLSCVCSLQNLPFSLKDLEKSRLTS